MSFLARLDAAQQEVDGDVKISPHKHSPRNEEKTGAAKEESDDAEREEKCAKMTGTKNNVKDREILKKFSEYLFDLFDANLMDGFKKIESFETNALPAFLHEDGVIEEYTFEQERLHKQFLDLFESLIEKFLIDEGATVPQFYQAVEREVKNGGLLSSSRSRKDKEFFEEAQEIVNIIAEYMTFEEWAKNMRTEALRRQKYSKRNQHLSHDVTSYKSSLQIAVESDLNHKASDLFNSSFNSSLSKPGEHRLHDEICSTSCK